MHSATGRSNRVLRVGRATHIAWVRPEYIELIAAGFKTVEARLAKVRGPVFGRVCAGDLLYFRETGGGFRLRAIAMAVLDFAELTPADVRAMGEEHGREVMAPRSYWRSRLACRYATLIWLTGVSVWTRGPAEARWSASAARSAWATITRA